MPRALPSMDPSSSGPQSLFHSLSVTTNTPDLSYCLKISVFARKRSTEHVGATMLKLGSGQCILATWAHVVDTFER